MKTQWILLAAAACLAFDFTIPIAHSSETSSSSSSNSDENSFGQRPEGFVVSGGLNWGIGTGASANGSTTSRTINTIELTAAPGWKIRDWSPRLLLAYDFTGQNTATDTVNNTNLRGTGYLIGVGTTYHWKRWDFLGGIEFFGTYTQGQKTADDKTSSFSKPLGFRLGGSYFFKDNWSADGLFHYVQYSSNTLGDAITDISSDRIRFWVLALGVSYHL